MSRLTGYLKPAFVFLTGAVLFLAMVGVTIAENVGGLIFAPFGPAMMACAGLMTPQRWNGRPHEGEIEIGGVPTPALVFPFVHGRFVASAAAVTLMTLPGLTAVPLAIVGGEPWIALGGAVWAAFFGPMAVVTVRRLTRAKYVAVTPDLLCLQAPANRVIVPWHDIESIGMLPMGDQMFYAVRLLKDTDLGAGRLTRRLNRTFGAHLYVQVDWLTCHPELVMKTLQSYLEGHGRTPQPG